MKNLYCFYDARDADRAWRNVAGSIHASGSAVTRDRLLWQFVERSERVVVANKARQDGIYFSRMPIDALVDFLDATVPASTVLPFLSQNRLALESLRFDAGFDFVVRDGVLMIEKAAFYGLL